MACKQPLSGRMRHKIRIEKRTITASSGEETESWAKYATPRAEIGNKIGRETFQARQEQTNKTVGMRVMYSAALDLVNPRDYRIVFNGNNYDIEDVDNVLFLNKEIVFTTSLQNG